MKSFLAALVIILSGAAHAAVTIPSVEIYTGSSSGSDTSAAGTVLPDGRRFVMWSSYDGVTHSVVSSTSSDGLTWSAPSTITTDGVWMSIFMHKGKMFRFGADYASYDSSTVTWTTSDDLGVTWGAVNTFVSPDNLYAISHPVVKRYAPNVGRLIQPVMVGLLGYGGYMWGASILYSDDDGVTWNRGGDTEQSENGFTEPSIVELPDGTLYMNLRKDTGYLTDDAWFQYKATSSDGGVTWSAVTATALGSPSSMAKIIESSTGTYSFVWNNVSVAASGPRYPLTVARSTDACETFTHFENIKEATSPTRWFEEPGVFVISPGRIGVVFESAEIGGGKPWTIHYAEFSDGSQLADGAYTLSGSYSISGQFVIH